MSTATCDFYQPVEVGAVFKFEGRNWKVTKIFPPQQKRYIDMKWTVYPVEAEEVK